MAPVEEVHLYLHEVPVILVIVVDEPVEDLNIAVIGEPQVAYATGLSLLEQEVEQPVVDKARVEVLHATLPDAVQQVVVDVVGAQLLERIVVHLLGLLQRPCLCAIVRHLGGDVVAVARVAAQCRARDALVESTAIDRCGVKVVYAMRQRIVHQLVDQLLVVAWQSHHAEAQQRNLLARAVLHTIGHHVASLGGGCLSLIILCQCTHRVECHHGSSQS